MMFMSSLHRVDTFSINVAKAMTILESLMWLILVVGVYRKLAQIRIQLFARLISFFGLSQMKMY